MGRKESLKAELHRFKEHVNQTMPIRKMILFGSRAAGKTGRDTDVDLILVSPKFKQLDFFKRGARMYDHWNLDYPVDFLCFTPEEFKHLCKKASIISEAIKYGVEI